VEAILTDEVGTIVGVAKAQDLPGEEAEWTTIVEKKPLGAHRQHWFDVERSVPEDAVFSHVRLITFPGI
jgi:allantoicase